MARHLSAAFNLSARGQVKSFKHPLEDPMTRRARSIVAIAMTLWLLPEAAAFARTPAPDNRRDRREDVRDRREDRRDRLHDGGIRDVREDVRDRREDRRDLRENRRDRREDRRDRRH
jgi:hypothetical protein